MHVTGPLCATQSAPTRVDMLEDGVEGIGDIEVLFLGLTSWSWMRPRLSAIARVRLSQKAS